MKTTKELIIADITAKVEAKLASQKVELSLFEDYYKSVTAVMDQVSFASKRKDDAKNSIKSAIDQLNIAGNSIKRSIAYSEDIDTKIKDLGVSPDRQYNEMRRDMFRGEQNIKEGLSALTKFQQELNKLSF
jgi:hypothetical protein